MAIGTKTIKQHVVEFISDPSIGGVYTDNIRDSTLLSGPWSWTVPAGVFMLKLDAISGGGGGGGGYNIGTAQAGGGGGNSGNGIMGMDLNVLPQSVLTITIGAGGNGGVTGTGSTTGGRTRIAGLTRSYHWRRPTLFSGIEGTVEFGYEYGGNAGNATATASGSAPTGANNTLARGGNPINNGTTGLTPANYSWYAPAGDGTNIGDINSHFGGRLWAQGATSGGAANTDPAVAGGNGGGMSVGGDIYNSQFAQLGVGSNEGGGNTTGSISRGGGGSGAHSFMAFGGKGGDGGIAGADGTFGSGGGGGGGGQPGGKGGNGYVRFIYWSAS